MPTCYLYERWSTASQSDGDSERRQLAAAERYVAQHPATQEHARLCCAGLTLDLTTRWRDAGVSAFRGQGQEALSAFVFAVQSKKIAKGSYLLIENADRLSRAAPLKGLAALERLTSLGVYVVTLSDGKRYDAESFEKEDVTDLLTALLHAHRAHSESAVKSRRVREALANKRRLAQDSRVPLGKLCPSWLVFDAGRLDGSGKGYVVDKAKARTVRLVFDLTASGLGNTQVARRLNRDKVAPLGTYYGHTSPRARLWSAGSVGQLVTNRAVLGEYAPHSTKIDEATGKRTRVPDGPAVPGMYPAVIPASLFAKVQRDRQKRRNPSGPRGAHVSNLFTGLLRCECRASIHLLTKRAGVKYLTCSARIAGSACRMQAWEYNKTERLLLALNHRVIDWRKALPQEREQHQTAVDHLEAELDSVQVESSSTALRIARLLDAVETGTKVDALTDRGLDPLVSRISTLTTLQETLNTRQESIRSELGHERERLRAARETVQARREAFAAFDKKDSDARTRLASVLRDVLSHIILGGEREHRSLELVFANGEPYRFLVSQDCKMVQDPHDGSVVVQLA